MIIFLLTVIFWIEFLSQHFYVSRLKAIAIKAHRYKANENPDYINGMLNPLIKPYNLRSGPRAEQPKVNTTSCGLHISGCEIKEWNAILY